MSDDTEIEDVSFLPGESLHRKALYEPNVIQRCRNWAGTKGRTTVIFFLIGLTMCVLLIILIATLANRGCGSDTKTPVNQSDNTSASAQHTKDYISTNGKEFPYRDIRLPKSIVPMNYVVFMHPNISQEKFEGFVEITCKVVEDIDYIVFHSKTLNISKLTVKNSDTKKPIIVTEYLEYEETEQIYVKLGSTVTKATELVIHVNFQGRLVSKLAGFYKSMYKTKSGEKRYIATTHFEPTDARAAFPCFDEPQLKAIFELKMIRDPGYTALFNMPLVSSNTYKQNLIQDSFQRSVKMSTYLVAFVVCDYANLTKSTARNVKVSVYAPPDVIESARFALNSAVTVLDYYEKYFGIEYPLPKQDLIAIPDFAAGAMENWGLITYRTTAILYDPAVSSSSNQQWVAVVVAHELAHQWFGNLVTMDWWNDLWLNEGFASYVEYIGSSIVQPPWQMMDQFVIDSCLPALYLDSLSNSHPISLPVHDPNEINEIFDSISYDKGASIIRMLNNYLGEDVFKTGLTAYLKKYRFGNAVTKDLWNSLGGKAASDINVGDMMDTWTQQMGYPVITLHTTGPNVTATQTRFLLYPQSDSKPEFTSDYGYQWQVPFSYSTSLVPSQVNKMLIKDKTATFPVPQTADWIKGNSGMFGYYRVNYDEENWIALTQQLNSDHTVFSPSERSGLIDDVFMLARAGLVKQKLALDLSMYMVNEDDYLPWSTLLSNLAYIEGRIDSKPVYTNYKRYLLKLMNRQLEKTEWEDTGTHLQKYLRSTILGKAVHLEHNASVASAMKLFNAWKQNRIGVSANLKSVVYLAGMAFGTEKDWELMWDAYLEETVASEQQKFLVSLGQTRDTRLLSRLLNYGLDESKVRSQDTARVVSVVARSPGGHILAWRFLQKNWDIFHERYGTMSFILSRLIKSVAGHFDTIFDLKEVTAFFSGRDVGSAKRAVQQVREKIRMNIDWLAAHEAEVTTWLEDHGA